MTLPPLVVAREAIAATGLPGRELVRRLWPAGAVYRECNSADVPLAGFASVWFSLDAVAAEVIRAKRARDLQAARSIVQLTKVQSSTPPGRFERIRHAAVSELLDLLR